MEMGRLARVFGWRDYPGSAYVLLAGNALAIVLAVFFALDPAEVIWAYWLESIIVGLFTAMTFLAIALRSFGGSSIEALFPLGAGAFFTLHYGGFHLGYLIFLLVLPWFNIADLDYLAIAGIGGVFMLSHGFSFVANILGRPSELENTMENLNRIMNAPYSRIIPMHMTIILSGVLMIPLTPLLMLAETDPMFRSAEWVMKFLVLLLFMAIKTIADLYGHLERHQKS